MDAKSEQSSRGASNVVASETWSHYLLHRPIDLLAALADEATEEVQQSVAWKWQLSWTHLHVSTSDFSLLPRGYNVVLH
jgi:hypothetical protein